ncbi:MAG: family 20 glycosylhydrolase [Bacteroidales bacterium]
MKRLVVIALLSWVYTSCLAQQEAPVFSAIPEPVKIEMGDGTFVFNQNTHIVTTEPLWAELTTYGSGQLEKWLGYLPETGVIPFSAPQQNRVVLIAEKPFKAELGLEGYKLEVSPAVIRIRSNTRQGALYGLQTLSQLVQAGKGSVAACEITDYPRFGYRGLHLDVSRHFMPASFIYQLLDYMAMHKLNVFHWHLTDDQGWRLEIKKYPRLVEVGAWRPNLEHLHWNDREGKESQARGIYGGYYSQEEVRQIVKYAESRGITIIPEIEMPAHAMAALAAYSQLSCSGANLGVHPGGVWPDTHIFCAGNDSTFDFLENVLTEVMDLFPGTYIHVGGDEADKTEWKRCSRCQTRIKQEGLKDEAELQSYFIQRIEKFLNSHGRILIGWDEILEGGLAPNAVVMSWRGEEGGIEAARQHHHVIMTPGSHCYFDHYQGDPSVEPLAIGGYTPLRKVYDYEPIPRVLSPEQAVYVMGAQANVWTEYMPDSKHVEYMIFPRLAALSEVLWSPADKRDWKSFSLRLKDQLDRYDKLGINYARSAFQVKVKPSVNTEQGYLELELITEAPYGEIQYTLDGKVPTASSPLYNDKLVLKRSAQLKTAVFYDGKQMAQVISQTYDLHKAFGKPVALQYPNAARYDGGGATGLCNGIFGSTSFTDGQWKGFEGSDAIVTIDLGKMQKISQIITDALQNSASWIFYPERVVFEVSQDGHNWKKIDEKVNEVSWQTPSPEVKYYETRKFRGKARFVRVTLKNRGVCPEGHSGAGQPAWLFVSEVVVH